MGGSDLLHKDGASVGSAQGNCEAYEEAVESLQIQGKVQICTKSFLDIVIYCVLLYKQSQLVIISTVL